MALVAAALETAGLRATAVDGAELVVAHQRGRGGDPELDLEASRQRVRSCWQRRRDDEVVLVTGFVAGDGDGGTVTLGRGASDLTATPLAGCLGAEAVEIWSDVDGLLSAPPRWVPQALPLSCLSYGQAAARTPGGDRVGAGLGAGGGRHRRCRRRSTSVEKPVRGPGPGPRRRPAAD